MSSLSLVLEGLEGADRGVPAVAQFDLKSLRSGPWEWDRVVKGTHSTNCWYQMVCNFNVYVKDGMVFREEQVGNYPAPNDPNAPDLNPKGCQKGVCYSHRVYDPSRIKYPLKRVGARGDGKWRRVSWDEALTEIADAMIDVLTTDGPDAIAEGAGTMGQILSSDGISWTGAFAALGIPVSSPTADNGDEHQGVGITFGKVNLSCSADNWFYSDLILIWGGNPAYTHIPNHHFISEARYHGTRVVTITPDYNPSSNHADLWVPVRPGTDAALALGMAHVIVREGLHNRAFIQEQTDLPLLVRLDTRRFLRQKDVKRGGADDILYFYDSAAKRVVEAPRATLALNGLDPALEGEYRVETLEGPVVVKPLLELFKEHLRAYTPERVAEITGVPPRVIEDLAREFGRARGVVNITTANWGKWYHGDLMERSIALLFALCGHLGRRGASFSAFSMLGLDTAVGGLQQRGDQVILAAAGADPRYATWREAGYTHEMILYEYVREAFAKGAMSPSSTFYYVHGGLLDLSLRHNWDPDLKRPLAEYVNESFDKGWQFVYPARGKDPKILFSYGGNPMRRARATKHVLDTLLPKLRQYVVLDWRMSASATYADFVLPVASWYERTFTMAAAVPETPFAHYNEKAAEPLWEAKGDWEIWVLLARKIQERARARGLTTFKDAQGQERRLDNVADKVTFNGLYTEEDEDAVARDLFVNATNVEKMEWEEFKEKGIAPYTGLGMIMRSVGNACEVTPGEPLIPLTWHTEKKEPYPTLTRRIQFYIDHDWYLELGEAFPVHKEPPKVGGDYPMILTGGHARWSIHTCWTDSPLLMGLQRGEPIAFVNAKDARARGIVDEDRVEVYNDVGSFVIQVAASPAVRPGQMVIYHNWENYQFKERQHFKNVMGSPINPIELVGGYFQLRPITMTCYPGLSDRDTRVEMRKAE